MGGTPAGSLPRSGLKKSIPDSVLFAVRIVYEFFVDFLYRPAAAVAAVRPVLGFRMFFLVLCRIEIVVGRLLRPWFRCRAGRLGALLPRVVIRAPVMVLAGRVFLMRFLSHRYQLSYGSGYRKNLLIPRIFYSNGNTGDPRGARG